MRISLLFRHRYKRILQAMTLAVAITCMTEVLYQNTYGYPNMQTIQLPFDVAQQENIQPVVVASQQQQQHQQHREQHAQQQQQQHQQTQPLQEIQHHHHEPTTVIIREDFLSFNFSDNERTDSASSNDTGRNLVLRDSSPRSVTITPKPHITELDDIFISVKTTGMYHNTRLAVIIKTWFQLARDQTWFFTDTDDKYYQEKTNGHLINTNCSVGHLRKPLCCKMSAELDAYYGSGKKWFCHFDDDNYVNVPRLVRLLDDYNPKLKWYLGKRMFSSPYQIQLNDTNSSIPTNEKATFWFAAGGAGFCLSHSLTSKMFPIAGGGKFMSIGDRIRYPDDITMGFILEHLLKVPLINLDKFHSHLEPLASIRPETFRDQVSFGFVRVKNKWNVLKIDGFDTKTDPQRFYSLHCHLFPYFSFCPRS